MTFDLRAFAFRRAQGAFGNAPWARVSREIDLLTRGDAARLKLEMVRYARTEVPYYAATKASDDVLESYPILTKDSIRRHPSELRSADHVARGAIANTSGGSTGEPVRFLQDVEFRRWNAAT